MLETTFLLLPFITSVFWLVLNPLINRRDWAQIGIQGVLLTAGLSSLCMAGMESCSNTQGITYCFLGGQFFTLCMVTMISYYIHTLENAGQASGYIMTWIAIPFSLLFAEIILIMLTGQEELVSFINNGYKGGMSNGNIAMIMHICSVWLYYGILGLQALWLIVYTIRKNVSGSTPILYWHFTAMAVMLIAESIFAGGYLSVHKVIPVIVSVLFSILIFLTSYVSLFHHRPDCTIKDLLAGTGGLEVSDAATLEAETQETIQGRMNMERIRIAASQDIDGGLSPETEPDDSLLSRFEHLIISQNLFLRPGIRVTDVASMLKTNRTYISKLVNDTYNMSFSDYINTLRIDYAEQYLLRNKDAKQTELARICGFPNASSFNNTFKKITGTTPRIWLATKQ